MGDKWREVSLGDVAEVVMGQSPPGRTYNDIGDGMPFLQGSAEFGSMHPAPIKWCSEPRRIAQPGDLLISVRAPVGDMNIADQKIAIGRGLAVIRGTESAGTAFLALALKARLQHLKSVSGGGMFESITKQGLTGVSIPLPTVEEQRRIADLLSTADQTVEALRTARTALAQLRTAVLATFLASPNDRWRKMRLEDFSKFAGGVAFPRSEQGRKSGDFPFYKVSDMNSTGNETYLTESANWIDGDQQARLRARLWPAGTVVFPKVGAALKTEKRRLLTRPSTFDNNIMGLVPLDGVVLPGYLLAVMQSISLGKLAQEGAVPSVNQKVVGAITVKLPPIDEQQRLIEIMEALDFATSSTQTSCASAEQLRDGVLTTLMQCRHRIPDSFDRFLDVSREAGNSFIGTTA